MGGDDFWIVRDAGSAIFECGAQWITDLLFHCEGEGDGFDLIGAETFLRALDELSADAAVIDARPAERLQFE